MEGVDPEHYRQVKDFLSSVLKPESVDHLLHNEYEPRQIESMADLISVKKQLNVPIKEYVEQVFPSYKDYPKDYLNNERYLDSTKESYRMLLLRNHSTFASFLTEAHVYKKHGFSLPLTLRNLFVPSQRLPHGVWYRWLSTIRNKSIEFNNAGYDLRRILETQPKEAMPEIITKYVNFIDEVLRIYDDFFQLKVSLIGMLNLLKDMFGIIDMYKHPGRLQRLLEYGRRFDGYERTVIHVPQLYVDIPYEIGTEIIEGNVPDQIITKVKHEIAKWKVHPDNPFVTAYLKEQFREVRTSNESRTPLSDEAKRLREEQDRINREVFGEKS